LDKVLPSGIDFLGFKKVLAAVLGRAKIFSSVKLGIVGLLVESVSFLE